MNTWCRYKKRILFRSPLLLLLLIAMLLLSGCGYHWGYQVLGLPADIHTIYIAPFKNPTNELKLGAQITSRLRQEFLRTGGLKLAPKDKADCFLEGRVISVRSTGVAYVRYNVSVERQISARFSARLVDRRTGRVLWQSRGLSRSENFPVGTNVMETQSYKDQALDKISAYIADVIHHQVTGMF